MDSVGRPLLFTLLISISALGCSSSPSAAPTSFATPTPAGLSPGDAVRVEIWREPDLSGDFIVDPSGAVVFPLLGERKVSGIVANRLEAQLKEEYEAYLVNPSVDITVLRRVAILGEVREPGLYTVDATITLTEALALAGGVSPTGNKGDIRLIRDGRAIVQSLDATHTISQTPIQSGDQIEVGERGWFKRNAAYVTVALGSVTSLAVAFIIR